MATLGHRTQQGVKLPWREATETEQLWLTSIRRKYKNSRLRSAFLHHPGTEFSVVVTGACARACSEKMSLCFKHTNHLFPLNLRTQHFFFFFLWWLPVTLLHGLDSVGLKYNHFFNYTPQSAYMHRKRNVAYGRALVASSLSGWLFSSECNKEG